MQSYEIFAAVVGAISVFLSVRQNVLSWPTALVNVALYAVVFYQAKLYADMGLQVVYFFLSLYGWYQWLYGGRNRTELPVSRLPRRLWLVLPALAVAGTAVLGTLLARTTDASLPYLDSALSVTSLIAQWMLTRKILENWVVWIVVDVVYVWMFIHKELHATAVLYAAFLVLAVLGYREWKVSLAKTTA